ncbi:hypothetical protein C8J56DRAFT_1163592 [Mycena floridula]|nr:hypothetical protein C8J56DRAFT_1163592 [Mycena floridula]
MLLLSIVVSLPYEWLFGDCSLIIAHSILVIGNNCLCWKEQMVLSLVPLVTSKSFLQDFTPKSLPYFILNIAEARVWVQHCT